MTSVYQYQVSGAAELSDRWQYIDILSNIHNWQHVTIVAIVYEKLLYNNDQC